MAFDAGYYKHDADSAAMKGLQAIPGFRQFVKAFMKIWSERQFRIANMSSCVRINERQMPEYYHMLPPICEKLGIDVPELYLKLDVNPNSYTSGDTKPFIVITSGLFETLPEELIPTVLAHECGHIACHHMLYSTMGRILLSGASTALSGVGFGIAGLASIPLEIAFFYWMRCSELSADRAAILCDGSSDKMTEVCMRLAGFDKDIDAVACKEDFIEQAKEYREMISNSKWDKTLEFFALRYEDHPFMSVRTLECEEWGKSEKFSAILHGEYTSPDSTESAEKTEEKADDVEEELDSEDMQSPGKDKGIFDFLKFGKKPKEASVQIEEETETQMSAPDEIRKYKELLDDGIISQEEFNEKKKQLLGL